MTSPIIEVRDVWRAKSKSCLRPIKEYVDAIKGLRKAENDSHLKIRKIEAETYENSKF